MAEEKESFTTKTLRALGGFRRTTSTGDSSQDEMIAEMARNRRVAAKTASAAGGTNGAASQLSFATGRPRDPMFYWRQNNLPYDVNKDDELKKVREYCSSPDEPVWMGDYSFKPIGEVQPGDEVIGWTKPEPGKKARLVRATVLATNRRVAPETVKITTESGRTWIGTPDHRFANPFYSPAQDGKPGAQPQFINPGVGKVLRHVIDPTQPLADAKEREIAAWLGGIYDGEGCGESIGQSRSHNPNVCQRIEDSLDILGLPHVADERAIYIRRQGSRLPAKQAMVDFLNWTQPTRRVSNAIDKRMLTRISGSQDRIVSVEPLGPGEVVSMETTTGTYIVSGFASSNCRLLYMTHPIIASCIDIFSKYPLIGMELVCKDEQLKEFYETLFFDQLNYEEFLIDVGREYWTVGEAWPFGSFNEILGVWEDDELLNPDDIEVERSPFLKDPRFMIRLPETLRKIIQTRQPAWEYKKLMEAYPELKEYSSDEALLPVSNILLKQLKFKGDTFHKRGIPILMRALRAIMQEEMMMAAMDSIADRLYTPLILVKLGASARDLGTDVPWIPTQDDLADFEEALDGALAADFRVIIHHFGVEMAPVFGRENMPNLSEDFERVEERILQTFGLSKTMLSGADGGETYAADALNRDLISQLLTTYQRLIKRLFEERARVVAEAQEHYDYDLRGGKRYPIMEEVLEYDEETGEPRIVEQPKLLIPELRFKTMSFSDEQTERDFIEQLVESGVPISIKTRMVNLPVELDEEMERRQDEAVQLAVAEQETRKRTFMELRAKGLPIPQDLLDDFLPKASNTIDAQTSGAVPEAEEQARVPMFGLDPTMMTPTVAPTAEDMAMPPDQTTTDAPPPVNPLDPMGLGMGGPMGGSVIPLPRNQIMQSQRPEESDEQRGGMPKPASRFEDPRHIGMRRKAKVNKDVPLGADAE